MKHMKVKKAENVRLKARIRAIIIDELNKLEIPIDEKQVQDICGGITLLFGLKPSEEKIRKHVWKKQGDIALDNPILQKEWLDECWRDINEQS